MNLMILSCLCVVKAWVRIPLTWEIVFLDMKHFQEISSWDHALEGLCEIINTTTGHLQVCWFPLMQTSGGLVEMMRNDASNCNLFPLEISLSTIPTPRIGESTWWGAVRIFKLQVSNISWCHRKHKRVLLFTGWRAVTLQVTKEMMCSNERGCG